MASIHNAPGGQRPPLAIATCVIAAALLSPPAYGQPKAFPQAEGFGASATGGRGGDVYHVTNLNNSGVGSLRYGIDNAPSVGRTIVFDVGGWIDIDSKLGITRDNITIAGQTAPGGIGVRGHQFSVGGHDIVIRHMRFRPGKGAGRVDAAGANADSNRVIYDHISAGFSYDESFSVAGTNLTLQYSSVAYGMEDHSAGSLIQNNGGAAGNLTFHHNVYAHNETRNPKARANLVDWLDNVVYGYQHGFIAGDSQNAVSPHWRTNFDGNTYISNGRPMMTGGRDFNYDLYYGTNALDRDGDSTHDPIDYSRAEAMANQAIVSSAYNWYSDPFAAAPVWQSGSPSSAYLRTLSEFGATPWDRDEVDQLVYNNVVNRQGARVSHENQLPISNSGYPSLGGVAAPTDTDRDGIPDEWELRQGTSPTQPSNNNDFDLDGYTDLEEYLNDLAAFAAVGPLEFSGIGRYADSKRWTNRWEPSRMDDVQINNGAAFVDAVGQRAGTLRVGNQADARLYLTSGWLESSGDVIIGGSARGHIRHYDGQLRVLSGELRIANGAYELHGGLLSTPVLRIDFGSEFAASGGTLVADQVIGDLLLDGGTLSASPGAADFADVDGDLGIATGVLAVDILSGSSADQYQVTGDVQLGGHLEVVPLNGFQPISGTSWEILSAASIAGAFDTVTPGFSTQQIGNSLWVMASSPSSVSVPLPEPSAVCTLAALLLAGVRLPRPRRSVVAGSLILAMFAAGQHAGADIVTAGQLVVDLRAHQLNAAANLWTNHASGQQAVGNFATVGGGNLQVANIAGVPKSLHVGANVQQAVVSSLATPAAIEGNATRSVEAWAYLDSVTSSATAVSWGASGNDQLSSFRYTTLSNGMFSGWNNDGAWSPGAVETGAWRHLAWTYDGSTVRGYIDGDFNSAYSAVDANASGVRLDTTHNLLTVGAARDGATDPWSGYLADIRVHTGVLSPNQILNNFHQGILVGPSGIQGDYNNDAAVNLADYVTWRDRLAGTTLLNEEVSPNKVDIADYLFWRERFGATTTGDPLSSITSQPIPEPTALCLLTLAITLYANHRRRSPRPCPDA